MIKAYKKFFDFSGRFRKEWAQGSAIEILRSIFEALQFPAILVLLNAILAGDTRPVWAIVCAGVMLVSIIGSILCWSAAHTKEGVASYRTCEDKRIEIGQRLKYMPMGYFNGHSLGNITAVATTTMEDMQAMSFAVIVRTLTGVLYSLVMSAVMLVFDWRIGGLFLLGTILFILVNGVLLKKSDEVSPIRLAAQTKLVDSVLEYIQGMGVVKSYHLTKDASSSLEQTIDETQRENLHVERLRIPYIALETAIVLVVSAAAVFVAISLYLAGVLPLISCLLIAVSAFMMYNRLLTAGKMFFMLPMLIASIDRVDAVRDSPTMDDGGRDIVPDFFDIELKNVSFGYEKADVIRDVSLSVPHNSTLAIVGPSGGGKTTLCSLMARFWDPNSGEILLGGHDLREYTQDSLLKNFSIVFQSVYLFRDTIENNIRFGKPDATHEEIVAAAQMACCHDFITALPNGYETVLGEGGATISGGEKQRISIARAILKDAPIILLDEATANVDPENESLLDEAIRSLTRNKTVVMIAHRLKTVRNADQIVVLDRGQIVQRGTHDELTALDGIYKTFVSARSQAANWRLGA